MGRRSWWIVAVFALMLAASGALRIYVRKVSPPPEQTRNPAPPQDPIPPELRQPVDIDQIPFRKPEILGARFRQLHAAVEKFAGDDWSREPLALVGRGYSDQRGYNAVWWTPPEVAMHRLPRLMEPGRFIRLSGTAHLRDAGMVPLVSFSSSNVEPSGWYASIDFICSALMDEPKERFSVSIIHFEASPSGRERRFCIPCGAMVGHAYDDSQRRAYSVRISSPVERPMGQIQTPPGQLPLAILESEAKFHEAALDEIRSLEAVARGSFDDGTARIETASMRNVNGGNPPMYDPVDDDTAPTPEIRQQLLDNLLKQIHELESFVDAHHGTMYATIRRGFPIWDALRRVPDE